MEIYKKLNKYYDENKKAFKNFKQRINIDENNKEEFGTIIKE
jgi:hypothetical protein